MSRYVIEESHAELLKPACLAADRAARILAVIDWPVAQTWRKALIEASGLRPRNFEADHDL